MIAMIAVCPSATAGGRWAEACSSTSELHDRRAGNELAPPVPNSQVVKNLQKDTG
jgi:hypothetical protein